MNSKDATNFYTYTTSIFKHMPVGVALFDVHDFRLLAVNDHYETFMNPEWRQGRAIGHPVTDCVPTWISEQEAQDVLAIFHHVVETGTPYSVEERYVPLQDQENSPSYWSWVLDPIFDEQGQVVQLLMTQNNVTSYVLARQKAEQATRDVEAQRVRLHTILDQLPAGVMLADADGHVNYTNCTAEKLLGDSSIPQEDTPLDSVPLLHSAFYLNGQPISPEDFPLARAVRGEDVESLETFIKKPDGSTMFVLTTATPLYDEQGTITGAVSVFRDISKRKSIEQQKNQFLSTASHELRTPITSIQGLAEILQLHISQGKSLDNPRCLRAIGDIAMQSQHMTRLIEGMLDISRLENASLELELLPHNLLALVEKVVEIQKVTHKMHSLHLTLDGVQADERLMVCIDEHSIMQVLDNLVNNAAKYSAVNSNIEVGIRHSSDSPEEVLLWVKDEGIGIAADELPHIFERFYRAKHIDRSISGLGIGLYLVHEHIFHHGGRVWAESTQGAGSTFYILLPL